MPRFKSINFCHKRPKNYFIFEKKNSFSSPLTANFWLRAGSVATFQWFEKMKQPSSGTILKC